MNQKSILVSVIMGSESDYDTMKHSEEILTEFEINYETLIISAHRTPERLYNYAKNVKDRNIRVIIAGAGGAAHLPGMVASLTLLPVLGVPITSSISGIDSLLSIVQMPKGTPVATFSIGKAGAQNAAIFAAKILACEYTHIEEKLNNWVERQKKSVKVKPNLD
jgi:5-(carboxyamino)imidazole ribonucleotide mutase